MPSLIDIKGKIYGDLYVLEYIGKSKWKCKCNCGRIVDIYGTYLRDRKVTDCGCKKILRRQREDLTNQKSHKLTAIKIDIERMLSRKKGDRNTYWICRCDCGNFTTIRTGDFKRGKVQSCGCIMTEAEGAINDLTGQTFGQLLVLEKTDKRQDGNVVWKCLCQCGNICERSGRNLHYRSSFLWML